MEVRATRPKDQKGAKIKAIGRSPELMKMCGWWERRVTSGPISIDVLKFWFLFFVLRELYRK